MLIDLNKIPEGGTRIKCVLDLVPVSQDREIEAVGSASIDVYVMEDEAGILVSGRFVGSATVPCARCLRSFEVPLEGAFNSMFRPHPEDFPKDTEVQEEDLDLSFLGQGQDSIDLREVIMEQVILNLPMKPLHSEDCKGFCPRCGTNKNETNCECPDKDIDPRLEPLARLLSLKEMK